MLVKNLRIGIVAHPEIPGALKLARKVLGLLKKEEVLLEQGLARKFGKHGATARVLRKAHAIVTIGGDGTVLFAQRQVPDVPILGINVGKTGFLADVEPKDISRALNMLVAGELQIEDRERLATEVGSKRLPDALNEVAVCSAKLGKTLAFRVFIDGSMAMDTRGDGVIITTPTGSTAYALAAGGPVIDPGLKALGVVPICPSRLYASPLIVPLMSHIEVELTRQDRPALLTIDGQPTNKVSPSEKIRFHRSDNPASFFRWSDEFYRKLREKL